MSASPPATPGIKDSISALRSILMMDTPTQSLLTGRPPSQAQQWQEMAELQQKVQQATDVAALATTVIFRRALLRPTNWSVRPPEKTTAQRYPARRPVHTADFVVVADGSSSIPVVSVDPVKSVDPSNQST